MKITLDNLRNHQTKKHSLKRFLIVLTILFVYTSYLVFKFGSEGIALAMLTWSTFVMATPIPDAGILLDFPLRILTGIRMVFSEMIVWVISISLNLYFLKFNPEVYNKTVITHIFYQILTHPWPDWVIILISLMGTFLALYFGDELLDVIFHHQRKKYRKNKHFYYIIIIVFILFLFYFLYRYFLSFFNLNF